MKEKHVRCFCAWVGWYYREKQQYFWIKVLHEVSAELVVFKSYVRNMLSVISGSVCRFSWKRFIGL